MTPDHAWLLLHNVQLQFHQLSRAAAPPDTIEFRYPQQELWAVADALKVALDLRWAPPVEAEADEYAGLFCLTQNSA